MATKKPHGTPVVLDPVDPDLMKIVLDMYSRWTGHDIAMAIMTMRQQQRLAAERELLQQQMAELSERLDNLPDA